MIRVINLLQRTGDDPIGSNFVAHVLSTCLPRDRDLAIAAADDVYHVEET
jgi:hypothetical protein